MNDFSELETELKKLRPRAVSPELITRVERVFTNASAASAEVSGRVATAGVLPKARRARINWLGLGLGAAAAAAFLLLARINTEHPIRRQNVVAVTPAPLVAPMPPPVDAFRPTRLTQVVYSQRDEGLHFPGGIDEPVRRVRSQKRETLRWHNPNTDTSLRISYPTEEVTFIPVSGQ